MNLIIGIVIGLIVLVVLVALHELGHAYAAKRNGVVVEEFGIGFPPKAYSFKKKTDKILPKGTIISINWLPLGGFVKLKGEHDSDSKKGDYGAASFWGKTQILFAGVAMNWLIAIIIFTVLSVFGMPKALDNQFYIKEDVRLTGGQTIVSAVGEGLPAEKAGIKSGDEILSIGGEEINTINQISEYSKENAGKTIELEISRDGKTEVKKIDVRTDNSDGKGYIGLSSERLGEKIYSTWSAPIVGVGTTVQFTGATFQGLGDLVANLFNGLAKQISTSSKTRSEGSAELNAAGAGVSGPIGIIGVIFPQAAQSGLVTVLFLAAIISLTLACMNTLPIPALDGGRWFLTFIFRKILKKPLTKEKEENINAIGFLALMVLSLVVIILDIIKIF
jgi:regulator of sigma E protease